MVHESKTGDLRAPPLCLTSSQTGSDVVEVYNCESPEVSKPLPHPPHPVMPLHLDLPEIEVASPTPTRKSVVSEVDPGEPDVAGTPSALTDGRRFSQRRGVRLKLTTAFGERSDSDNGSAKAAKVQQLRAQMAMLTERLASLKARKDSSSDSVSVAESVSSVVSTRLAGFKQKILKLGRSECEEKRTRMTPHETMGGSLNMHDLVMAKVRQMKKNREYSAAEHHMWAREHNTGYIPGTPMDWQDWYEELDRRSSDPEVWLDLVTPAAEDDAGSFKWGDFNMNIGQAKKLAHNRPQRTLENQNYDTTPDRLLQYYAKADKDYDGSLALHEISWILKHRDFAYLASRFRDLYKAAKVSSGDGVDGLTLPEFAMLYTCMKMAKLVKESPRSAMRGGVQVTDFCSDDVIYQNIYSRDDLQRFWFGHRKGGFKRWVHVAAPTEPLLLHLAVKYHLHPLGVKEAVKFIESEEPLPASFDRFGNHYYLCVCYCYLTSTNPVQYRTANIVLFLAGTPKWDTLISFVNPESQQQPTREFGPMGQPTDVWTILMDTIRASNCRVRDQKSDFLVYEILCICFEELKPITVAERAQLGLYHEILMEKKHAFPTEYLQHLSRIVVELGELHRSVRPLKHLVNQLLDEPTVSKFTKTYLFNLDTDIQQGIDDIQLLRETCKSLTDDYHRFNEMRLNDALGLLTVASAVFMPAQFVSGVYGMNFTQMPELKWKYGYLMVWIFFIAYFIVGGYVAWAKFGTIVAQKDSEPSGSMTAVVATRVGAQSGTTPSISSHGSDEDDGTASSASSQSSKTEDTSSDDGWG